MGSYEMPGLYGSELLNHEIPVKHPQTRQKQAARQSSGALKMGIPSLGPAPEAWNRRMDAQTGNRKERRKEKKKARKSG